MLRIVTQFGRVTNIDFPTIDRQYVGEDFQQSRFTGTAAADQSDAFAGPDNQVEIADDRFFGIVRKAKPFKTDFE